ELTERIKKIGHITRSVYYIYHNEDRLGYFDILHKKYFYGQSAKYYFSKQAENKKDNRVQSNITLRQKIANVINNPVVLLTSFLLPNKQLSTKSAKTTKFIRSSYIKKWRLFFDNPPVSLAFIFLRTTELSAMGFGYLFSLFKKEPQEAVSHK
ncbi:MAG: hypothetical protein WC570_02175, partial [Patescibacteria group bacterium]